MYRLQNKLLVYFLVTSIIPVLVIGLFGYFVAKDAMEDKMSADTETLLQQVRQNVDNKVVKIEKSLDLITADQEVQVIMEEVAFGEQGLPAYDAAHALNNILYSTFFRENEILSCLLFQANGGSYAYNGYIPSDQAARAAPFYQEILDGKGTIVWTMPEDTAFHTVEPGGRYIVGAVVRDTNNRRDLKELGVVCLELKGDMFSELLTNAQSAPDVDLYLVDAQDTLLAATQGTDMEQTDFGAIREALGEAEYGTMYLPSKDGPRMVSFLRCSAKDWMIVQSIPRDQYLAGINSIGLFTALVCVICMGLIILLAYVISSSVTQPVRALYRSMQAVSKGNFDVTVPVTGRDEISEICAGFNELVKRTGALFADSIEKERQLQESSLQALRYQINPHFLYNTLATIALVVRSKRLPEAQEMIGALSRLLQKTLGNNGELVPLAEELDNIRDYLSIQQVWYKNGIQVTFSVEESLLPVKVPCMLLQPIVENAINHGLSRRLNKRQDAQLTLSARRDGTDLCLVVWDNGVGMSAERIRTMLDGSAHRTNSKNHIGLYNINQRIQLQYGASYGVSIASQEGQYCEVTVRLPVEQPMKQITERTDEC